MKSDPQGRSFIYDSENKQVHIELIQQGFSQSAIGEYFYDGDGRRVKKKVYDGGVLSETIIFVYDAAGKQIAEYSTSVAEPEVAKVAYLTNDHLGSPRINTDRDGDVTSRHDYHPFGEEIALHASNEGRVAELGYQPDTVRKQFTGYERDGETGLDFAQARVYANLLGRFTSVDPTLASLKPENPQTVNRYLYGLNNPLLYVDPDGKEPVTIGDWSSLSSEQQRLFISYAEYNYGSQIGDGDPAAFAEKLFNESADFANGLQGSGDGLGLVTQAQLATFIATTTMLEKRGVIGELASVHTIKGDETERSRYRIRGDLKNNSASVKAIKKAFPRGIGGSGHGEYSDSNREGRYLKEPNGQVSLVPGSTGYEADIDFRCLVCNDHRKSDGSNSDVRANTGKESHYDRFDKEYGPTRALMPTSEVPK